MTEVQQFLAVDLNRFILEFFIILLFTLKFSDILALAKKKTGIITKWELDRKREQEAIERHSCELEEIKTNLAAVREKLNVLSQMLVELQEKEDESERYDLRARISSLYRMYHERFAREPLDAVWTQMEKDSFNGLVKSYENHGGKNSFVHDTCLQESEMWLVKEESK